MTGLWLRVGRECSLPILRRFDSLHASPSFLANSFQRKNHNLVEHVTSGDENDDTPSIPRKRKAKRSKPNSDIKRKYVSYLAKFSFYIEIYCRRGRPPRKRKKEELDADDDDSKDESDSDLPQNEHRNGEQGSIQVKGESPPDSKGEDEQLKPKTGVGLRTRASAKVRPLNSTYIFSSEP